MRDFVVFDPATGRILRRGVTTGAVADQAEPPLRVIAAAGSFRTDYVDIAASPPLTPTKSALSASGEPPVRREPRVLPRPELSGFDRTAVAAGEVLTMTAPEGCVVIVDGTPYPPQSGGTLAIRFDHPGVYVVEIDHFPFLPFRAEITCSS